MIESAIGGKNLTFTIEGRQRFPVRVRYARDFREDLEAMKDVLVAAPNGAQIPLERNCRHWGCDGTFDDHQREWTSSRNCPDECTGPDVGGFVDEAKRLSRERVSMPPGYYVEWSGQYENQIRAKKRLQIVIPIVLVVIFVLLYMTYHSAKEALHVLLAVPFALTGGIFLLKFLGYNFSVAVWVGFIALFGTAVQTGVVMVIYLEEAVRRKIAATGGLTMETLARSSHGGRVASPTSEGHDGRDSSCRAAADHVVHPNRGGGHEAPCDTCPWGHDQLAISCADCYAGDLHRAPRTEIAQLAV